MLFLGLVVVICSFVVTVGGVDYECFVLSADDVFDLSLY